MKYTPIRTERFTIFSHEIRRDEKVGGMCRTVFQAWFHSEDVAKPVCIVTINESLMDYVEWVHVDEQYRRQGIATEVMHAIESYIPGITLDGATEAGEAWCDHYERLYPSCQFGIALEDRWRNLCTTNVPHHGSQDEYHKLVQKLGSHEAAEKQIATRLRELADIVESPDYPKVFGWTDEGHPSPIGSVAITLSIPWGG